MFGRGWSTLDDEREWEADEVEVCTDSIDVLVVGLEDMRSVGAV